MKHMQKHVLLILAALSIWGVAPAKELRVVKPEDVGMSSAKLAKVDEVMKGLLAEKKLAGAIVAVARKGKVVHFGAYGKMDLKGDKPMRPGTIFK